MFNVSSSNVDDEVYQCWQNPMNKANGEPKAADDSRHALLVVAASFLSCLLVCHAHALATLSEQPSASAA